MMRKTMIILALIAGIGLAAGISWAGPWGGGPRGGFHNGYGSCWQEGAGFSNGTGFPNQKFLDETAPLRSELAGKRGEYQALMRGENPDPAQAGKLQREMAGLRDQIRSKAREYGVKPYQGARHGRGWGGRGGPCR